MPTRRTAGSEDEGGRGLAMVDDQADFWGFYPTDLGKVVFAGWDLASVRTAPHPLAVTA